MKPQNLIRDTRSRGFTLIELLVVISIIAILAGFALPVLTKAQKNGRIADTVNNAHQIALALKMFASDNEGSYPMFANSDDATTPVESSNAAFQLLMPKYSSSKAIFINKASAWCKQAGAAAPTAENQYKVGIGECDWVYVRGLSETSDPRAPLVATAFKPGSIVYSTNTSDKGGVWGGSDAVVVFVDHSAKHVPKLKEESAKTTFIPRPDVPTSNLFLFDDDWVGKEAKVLEPMGAG
jgi:prepilin-type N-terminal cleavage/methylation domain-containing protein